jgi:hypothetical protein
MPAVHIGNHERPRSALNQVDGILYLAAVLIRTLLTELDESQLAALFRHNRFCRVLGGILVERSQVSATGKKRRA